MKSFKQIIISTIGIFIFSTALLAQRGHEQHGERLKSALELSDAQWEQLQPILQDQHEKMKALRDQEFESREDRRAAFQDIHSESETAITEILTAEQIAKWDAMKKQRRSGKGKMHKPLLSIEEKQAMKQEMEAYKKEKIDPVLFKERTEFDQQISTEDQQEIDRLRIAMKEKKKAHKAKTKTMRDSGQKPTKEERMAHKEKMENDPDIKSLNALVEKYQEPLTAIHNKLAPQREQWKADMKEIAKKYKTTAKEGEEGEGPHTRHHRRHHAKARKAEAHSFSRFLLMDPSKETKANKGQQGKSAIGKFNVFPNPATTSSTVEYSLKKDSHIKLSLRDKEGNTIRILEEGDFAKGDHTFQVPVSDLKNGIYYFSIEDGTGKIKSKKVAVNN